MWNHILDFHNSLKKNKKHVDFLLTPRLEGDKVISCTCLLPRVRDRWRRKREARQKHILGSLATEVALVTTSQSSKTVRTTCPKAHPRLISTVAPYQTAQLCVNFLLSFFRELGCLPSLIRPPRCKVPQITAVPTASEEPWRPETEPGPRT